MNSLEFNPAAIRVRFTKDVMWVELVDGRILGVPLAYFPRLAKASMANRKKYVLSGAGRGIHWVTLDEDISVQGLIFGMGDQTVSRQPFPAHASI